MVWAIITLIGISICSYNLGYCGAKIKALNEFKTVMEKIHDKIMSSDFSDEYQRGHALGLIHAIEIIQNSNMFKEE